MKLKKSKKLKIININELKILLANKTTEMLHGKDAAKNSEQAAKEKLFQETLWVRTCLKLMFNQIK